MDSLNEELDSELKRHEFEILQRLVTPRNIELLLDRLKTQQKEGSIFQNNTELLQGKLLVGLDQLKDGARKRDEVIAVKNQLEEDLEKLRNHGLKSGSISGQGELTQLESLWMSRNDNNLMQGGMSSTYGAPYSPHNILGGGLSSSCDGGVSGTHYNQHEPASMGLFYGADESYD